MSSQSDAMASRCGTSRKRRCATATRILEAIEMTNKGAPISQVTATYGLSSSVVRTWKRAGLEMGFSEGAEMWGGYRSSLDVALFKWYLGRVKEGQYLTREMIQFKAKELNLEMFGGDYVPGLNWVSRWKKRFGIRRRLKNRNPTQPCPTAPSTHNLYQTHQNDPSNENQHTQTAFAQNLCLQQKPNVSSQFIAKDKSSFIKHTAEVSLQQGTTEHSESLEEDDDVLKELDSVLSGFQKKVIYGNKESNDESLKRSRNSDEGYVPKSKIFATKENVGMNIHHRFARTLDDTRPKKYGKTYVKPEAVQRNKLDCESSKISDSEEASEIEFLSEENTLSDTERIVSDDEEQSSDDVTSDANSSTSLIESSNKKVKGEQQSVEKKYNGKMNKTETEVDDTFSIETTLPNLSNSEDETVKGSEMVTTVSKIREGGSSGICDSGGVAVLESNSYDVEDNGFENAQRWKKAFTHSTVSESKEYHAIVVDSSSGEDNDEENHSNNKDVDIDDDVILVEYKSEPIVIDSSDSDNGEEADEDKCYLKESHHRHSQFKIVLLNTKDGDKDFSILDADSLETEPRVIIFDKK